MQASTRNLSVAALIRAFVMETAAPSLCPHNNLYDNFGLYDSVFGLKMETIDRFFLPPDKSFFLFGPRGTGKSTLVKRAFKDALYLDLLDPEVFRLYSANPERLRERLLARRMG